MSRTRWIAVFGVGVALLATGATAQDRQPAPTGQPAAAQMNPFQDCARACDDCARICEMCGTHCTKMLAEGRKEHLKTAQTCQDCATLCSAASCVISRQGPFWDLICTSCAEACKRCGDACEVHAAHDPMMKQCAEECRKCEKACREMLKNATGQPVPPKTP